MRPEKSTACDPFLGNKHLGGAIVEFVELVVLFCPVVFADELEFEDGA